MYATTLKAWFSVRGATTAIFARPHQTQQFAIGQDRSLLGRSPKCPEWPVRPKPAIHSTSLERRLSPTSRSFQLPRLSFRRRGTDVNERPQLGSAGGALNVALWVLPPSHRQEVRAGREHSRHGSIPRSPRRIKWQLTTPSRTVSRSVERGYSRD